MRVTKSYPVPINSLRLRSDPLSSALGRATRAPILWRASGSATRQRLRGSKERLDIAPQQRIEGHCPGQRNARLARRTVALRRLDHGAGDYEPERPLQVRGVREPLGSGPAPCRRPRGPASPPPGHPCRHCLPPRRRDRQPRLAAQLLHRRQVGPGAGVGGVDRQGTLDVPRRGGQPQRAATSSRSARCGSRRHHWVHGQGGPPAGATADPRPSTPAPCRPRSGGS